MAPPLRARRPLLFALLLVFASFAKPGLADDVELRWIPTGEADVIGYNFYISRFRLGPLVAAPIDVGWPLGDANGVASALVASLDRSMTLGIEVTSYDRLRQESTRSNRVVLPASTTETLGETVWSANFNAAELNVTPEDFVDPTETFRVSSFLDGNRALEAHSAVGLVAATYDGYESLYWGNYELTGRLMTRRSTAIAGIGVRADVFMDSWFGFGLDGSGTIALSEEGKGRLHCRYSTSTGERATPLSWLRFRLRITNSEGRARLRAKIWSTATTEPVVWQADCWTDVQVPQVWGELAFYREGTGSVYFDDLAVRLVLGQPDPLPPPWVEPPPPEYEDGEQ